MLARLRAGGKRKVARPDPYRTEVFRRGLDGKLHPIEGWTTTGPFEFGRWARNIDWLGFAHDMADLGARALAGGGAPGLASRLGVTGAAGRGLTRSDAATLAAGTYVAADEAAHDLRSRQAPKP